MRSILNEPQMKSKLEIGVFESRLDLIAFPHAAGRSDSQDQQEGKHDALPG
jgi:hypothetical protein